MARPGGMCWLHCAVFPSNTFLSIEKINILKSDIFFENCAWTNLDAMSVPVKLSPRPFCIISRNYAE